MSLIKYMLECEQGKVTILERAIAGLEQAAYAEKVYTLADDYSPYYTYAIGKLTRALNLAKAKIDILQSRDQTITGIFAAMDKVDDQGDEIS